MNGNNALVRAIRGPILLITLGVLMAIDQAGSYAFSRTWPALIIVFGIMKLLERTGVRERPETPSGDSPVGNLP